MKRDNLAEAILAAAFFAIALTPRFAKAQSSEEAMAFQNCKGMSVEEAFHNKSCRIVFRKLHITKSDLAKIQSCESQTSDTENSYCQEMAEKHPDLAHGHGMDGSSEGP